MPLFRIRQRWSNGTIAVRPGEVYELTGEEAAQIATDCPGGLEELTAAETAAIHEGLAAAGITAASFRPPAPDTSGIGRGSGDGAMTSTNMTGLVAR